VCVCAGVRMVAQIQLLLPDTKEQNTVAEKKHVQKRTVGKKSVHKGAEQKQTAMQEDRRRPLFNVF
jgi:hypothetical protein